jgi:hypothetical protein
MLATLARLLVGAILPAAAAAAASDALVADLDRRLAGGGVEAVNTHLDAHWGSDMVPLNRKTADCDLQAVALSIQLIRSANAKAAEAHGESLRTAAGRCPGFVLALASHVEIPRYCASVASWSVGQTARELRRRVAAIESDKVLRSSPRGMSCRAAYLYELHNTRVVLRSMPPRSIHPGK